MRPHVDQFDRDALDDHCLTDHTPAGDGDETETAPENPDVGAPGGDRSHPPTHYRKQATMTVPTTGSCRYCTVPVDDGDVCQFCATYTPPTPGPSIPQRLDDAVRRIDALRRDLAGILAALPGEVSMCLVLDLAAAGTRLRDAAVLCDRAADQLDEEVAR